MSQPIIVNSIHVSNDMFGYHVSFKTIEECAWLRNQMAVVSPILETHLGRFNLRLNAAEYHNFVSMLSIWEAAGYIAVP